MINFDVVDFSERRSEEVIFIMESLLWSLLGYYVIVHYSFWIQVPNEDFDVQQQAIVSLEFRTVLKVGMLFSVTRPDLISYIG